MLGNKAWKGEHWKCVWYFVYVCPMILKLSSLYFWHTLDMLTNCQIISYMGIWVVIVVFLGVITLAA